MYGVRDYEYTYDYTRQGKIYLEEYFINALELLYRGKRASLYTCAPVCVEQTKIPNEAISKLAVPVIGQTLVPNVCEALLFTASAYKTPGWTIRPVRGLPVFRLDSQQIAVDGQSAVGIVGQDLFG